MVIGKPQSSRAVFTGCCCGGYCYWIRILLSFLNLCRSLPFCKFHRNTLSKDRISRIVLVLAGWLASGSFRCRLALESKCDRHACSYRKCHIVPVLLNLHTDIVKSEVMVCAVVLSRLDRSGRRQRDGIAKLYIIQRSKVFSGIRTTVNRFGSIYVAQSV